MVCFETAFIIRILKRKRFGSNFIFFNFIITFELDLGIIFLLFVVLEVLRVNLQEITKLGYF